MAILNLAINIQNPVPVNGQYTFSTQFVDVNGNLISDSRFPQNQVHSTSQIVNPYQIPVEVANGTYTIGDIRAKVTYKNKIVYFPLLGEQVSCSTECGSIFPVISVVSQGSSNYLVTLSSSYTGSLSWKIVSNGGTTVTSGTSNVSGSSFTILAPTLTSQTYLLEVNGVTCIGKSIKQFTGVNSKPTCERGPTLNSIVETSTTSVKVLYDGAGIYSITWRIKNSTGDIVRNGVIKHVSIAQPGDQTFNNNTPVFTFPALEAGNYTIEVEGTLCTSPVSSLPFTITGTVQPLAFISGSPSATGSAGNYTLSIAINKTGSYNVTVLNSTTGTYYRNNTAVSFTANTPYTISSLPVGNYVVKVGTLETQINIADTGVTPCSSIGRNPVIGSIINSNTTTLEFVYDAENVTSFKWRIKESGNTVRNGIGYPTNNHPVITFNELNPGNYVLEIEGNNCSSPVDSEPFTIAAVTPGNNAGLRVQQVGNRTFLWRDSMDFRVSVNPTNGKVTLDYADLKTSPGGQQVRAYLMNEHDALIRDSDKNALKAGADMHDGKYHFFIRYAATSIASNWDQTKANMWPLFLNPATNMTNSARLETAVIEILTNVTI